LGSALDRPLQKNSAGGPFIVAQQPDISGTSTASLFEAFLSEEPLTCLVPSRQTKDLLKEERNLTPLTEEASTLPVTKALCTRIFFELQDLHRKGC
jgi:hypothetical protein